MLFDKFKSKVSVCFNDHFYSFAFATTFQRAQTEGVTFLSNKNSKKTIFSVSGLDHVSHDDILPYSPNERQPLRHELFDKFLAPVPGTKRYDSTEALYIWQLRHHPWIVLNEVHRETTEKIRVTVIPFYVSFILISQEV